jgi:2,4-dienoyl-CoA reductase-like NADH-dependent reductase (Old Yellow Enzyme family)
MSILFEPKAIGKMEVKNRFVRSPTGDKMATQEGKCTDTLVDFYSALAEGGAGLLITGQAYVHLNGRLLPSFIGLHADDVVEGYRRLTAAVHARKARIFAQLGHGGRCIFRKDYAFGTPMAPSPVKVELTGMTPRQMTEEDIQEIIDAFAQAARRAKEAGFDGVQIHACHGDLIHSFLSPYTNRRTDRWGGSLDNTLRFLLEVYGKTRGLVGEDYPVTVKINAQDYVKGGITIDLSKRHAEAIQKAGFDALEISAGTHLERHFNLSRGDIPKNYFAIQGKSESQKRKLIQKLKAMKNEVKFEEAYLRPFAREIRKGTDIPLILPGGQRTVSVMEDILREGDADFIGLCRPLIRDPDFPNKVRKGLKRSDCLNCNRCLVDKPPICYQKYYRPPHF